VAANGRFGKGSFTFMRQDSGMKMVLILCLLPLTGCADLLTYVGGTTVGSIATIHRTPVDAVYSYMTDQDCSVVRLDQGKRYCRATEPPPPPPAYCTRSLGQVDCWRSPDSLPGGYRGVADGPVMTPEQEANRLRGWP